MFIFRLINILVDRQKKKKQKTNKQQTSTHVSTKLYFYFSYLRKLQSAKLFSISQKITINKAVLYIGRSLQKITISQHPNKAKTTRKRKRKGRRRRKEGMMEEAGLKNIPFKRVAPSEYVPWSSSINGQD